MSDFGERLQILQQQLPSILKSQVARLPFILHVFVEENFNEGRASGVFSSSDKLNVNSGGLTRSFIPNQPGNINKVESTSTMVALVYGTEVIYAPLHESGGFVKSKGKMHKYMWAKFYETKDNDFRILALSVLKNGGVNIKARPFFNPAIKKFEQEGLPMLAESILRDMAAILNN